MFPYPSSMVLPVILQRIVVPLGTKLPTLWKYVRDKPARKLVFSSAVELSILPDFSS